MSAYGQTDEVMRKILVLYLKGSVREIYLHRIRDLETVQIDAIWTVVKQELKRKISTGNRTQIYSR